MSFIDESFIEFAKFQPLYGCLVSNVSVGGALEVIHVGAEVEMLSAELCQLPLLQLLHFVSVQEVLEFRALQLDAIEDDRA